MTYLILMPVSVTIDQNEIFLREFEWFSLFVCLFVCSGQPSDLDWCCLSSLRLSNTHRTSQTLFVLMNWMFLLWFYGKLIPWRGISIYSHSQYNSNRKHPDFTRINAIPWKLLLHSDKLVPSRQIYWIQL